MTELWHDLDHFSLWYYAKDFTHVSFYRLKTISRLCELFDFEIIFNDKKRVIVLRNL